MVLKPQKKEKKKQKIKNFKWTGKIRSFNQYKGTNFRIIAFNWFGDKIGEYEVNTTRERVPDEEKSDLVD